MRAGAQDLFAVGVVPRALLRIREDLPRVLDLLKALVRGVCLVVVLVCTRRSALYDAAPGAELAGGYAHTYKMPLGSRASRAPMQATRISSAGSLSPSSQEEQAREAECGKVAHYVPGCHWSASVR